MNLMPACPQFAQHHFGADDMAVAGGLDTVEDIHGDRNSVEAVKM
jgi:hypothetical protein